MLDDGVMVKENPRVPEPPVEVKLARNECVTVFGIRAHSRDVEVVNLRHVTAYCYGERRTAHRRSGPGWCERGTRRTTRATAQVHWVDVASCALSESR